jgi:hypothetical protein
VRQFEDLLGDTSQVNVDVVDLGIELREARENCSRLQDSIRRKRAALGVSQRAALGRIKDSLFLQIRMNARAVKIRICDRLRQRKFELERFERSYRQAVNGEFVSIEARYLYPQRVTEHKLTTHTESSVKRREPGILKLAKTYNGHCKHLQDLVRQRKAPPRVILPQPIDTHRLFGLDVDDDIWQDAGLDDDAVDGPPLWLSDEDTREGIKNLLLLDRCREEEERLMKERSAMQEWMSEEWSTLERACLKQGTSIFCLGEHS